jgi:hypothetical protein
MENLDQFVDKFGGYSESYWFYNNTEEILYDKKEHVYRLVKDGQLIEVPSVTTITHIIDKSPILIPWSCKEMSKQILDNVIANGLPQDYDEIEQLVTKAKFAWKTKLDDAGDIGSQVHNWIEQYIKKELNIINWVPPMPTDERAVKCINAALNWIKEHSVQFLTTETKIFSKTHKYAGTFDCKARISSCGDKLCCPVEYKNVLGVIDWKSSTSLYLEFLLQIAGYVLALTEEYPAEPINDCWVIHLGRESGEFNAWHIDNTEELTLYQFGFLNCLRLYHSVAHAQEAVKSKNENIKNARKAESKANKDAQLKIKCAKADVYKGVKYPRCNGGEPCITCLNKYKETHEEPRSYQEPNG